MRAALTAVAVVLLTLTSVAAPVAAAGDEIQVSAEIQPLADAFHKAGIPVTAANIEAFALAISPAIPS